MTVKDLLVAQTEEAGRMLAKCFSGIPEDQADTTLDPMMSARTQALHLCECYEAAAKYVHGEKYEWGNYKSPATTLSDTVAEMFKLRDVAVKEFLAVNTDEAILSNEGFLIGHDHYHVGQLVILHLAIDPQWDSYCIYSKD